MQGRPRLAWLRQRALRPVRRRLQKAIWAAAWVWRRLMVRTTFIAITGSLGKTTAKECLATILGERSFTARTWRNQNGGIFVPLTLLRVRPWHRFAVVEIGIAGAGQIGRSARLVKPDVAVITSIARVHGFKYESVDQIAAEKLRLLDALAKGKVAILNGDDKRLASAGDPDKHRILRFGTGPECDLRASSVRAGWPERMRFRAEYGGAAAEVRTQLVGTHQLPAVLAAIAGALACGVPLEAAAWAAGETAPFPGRMQPVRTPGGVTFLRDDYTSAQATLMPALEVLETARAKRRVLVISDFVDTSFAPRRRAAFLARFAARATELAVFYGENANRARDAAIHAGVPPENVRAFLDLREADAFLKQELQEGDLVLVRNRLADHLVRLVFAQVSPLACWKQDCRKRIECDICWELGADRKALAQLEAAPTPDSAI